MPKLLYYNTMKPHPTSNFIKLILSHNTQSTGIRIPNNFTQEHGKELLDRVILKLPNADVWQVDLIKSRGEIWLKNGWWDFADRYGLKFGHFLMFEYQGFSIFGVTIFNATGSEILYPLSKTDQPTNPTKQVKLEDEDQKPNLNINNDGGECSRKHRRKEDGRKAVERAKLNFKSHKPFFMVYMHQSCVTRNTGPTVPIKFRRKYWRDSKKHTKYLLQLANHGRPKTWEVVVHNTHLGDADWLKFVKENGIAVGDICVFELINKHQNVLAVTILRSDAT